MLSYAGVPLIQPDEALLTWVRQAIDPADVWHFEQRSWPGPGEAQLSGPPDWPDTPLRLNRLVWPTGATRWGHFFGVCDEAQLALIRSAVFPSTGDYAAADLILADGTSAVTTSLWMLPARPLQQTGGQSFYLLTLVDDRYFWQQGGAALTLTAGTTTWATFFATIAAALGIDLDVDTIPAAYLKPPEELAVLYESVPPVLDAAAYSCGLRLVRQLDGTCRLWSVDSSRASVAAQLAALTTADRLAGGIFALSGGADDTALLPASVRLVFRRSDDDTAVYALAPVTLAGLALPEYPGLTGYDGVQVFHSTAAADGASPTNLSELEALGTAFAKDWYRWQAGRLDLVLQGYPGWTLTGLEDRAELRHDALLATRVARRPFNDTGEEVYHRGSAAPMPDDHGGGGGCSAMVTLNQTDCVLATVGGETFFLHYAAGSWSGAGVYAYPGGSGTFAFSFSAGRPHLALDGKELLDCGNDCFKGGPLTGHAPAGPPAGGPCTGETFMVCVRCVCCTPGWDGPGWYCVETDPGPPQVCVPLELIAEDQCDGDIVICSGPYGSEAEAMAHCGPPVEGDGCCGNPDTLVVTFSDTTGDCGALAGLSITLTRGSADPLNPAYNQYSGAGGAGGCATTTCQYICGPDTPGLQVVFGVDNEAHSTLTALSCPPLSATFMAFMTFGAEATCCTGGFTATVHE